jgi:hypothetical protein
MINKLYISTVDYDWNRDTSVLGNRHNIDKIISRADSIDCHTSVEDLYCENISVACNNATEIILVNVDENIDITNNNCFSYGRLFNELLRHKEKVKNFTWNKKFNHLKKVRTTNTPVLWTAGCSVTAGAAITLNERWGTLVSNYLNLPEITLSKGGTSIVWSADQILRSDIREGDIVVWGLTNVSRVEVAEDWNFNPTTIVEYLTTKKEHQYWTVDYFESETQVLMALRNILQVINFCQKVKAPLYLANILDIAWVGVMLKDFKNFIDLTQDLVVNGNTIVFKDLGTDNSHPGPQQHQQYAEKIFNLIKESNHGKTI